MELPNSKENKRFWLTGKIFEKLKNDTYLVQKDDRVSKKSHGHLTKLPMIENISAKLGGGCKFFFNPHMATSDQSINTFTANIYE